MEEAMLLGDLIMKFEMIDHLLDTMDTKVIISNPLRERRPLEVKKGVSARDLLPVPVSVIDETFLDKLGVVPSDYHEFVWLIFRLQF